MKILLCLLLGILFFSCNDEKLNDVSQIKNSEPIIYRELKKPTLRKLIYLQLAGDYPEWIDFDLAMKMKIKSENYLDTKNNQLVYWIEPTRSDSNIFDFEKNAFEVFDFFCEEDSVIRLPKYNHFTSSEQPKWKVIMYSSFKKIGKIENDSLILFN